MIDIDIYGNQLTNTFISKTSSTAQKLKPKVYAYWLESRNVVFDMDSNPPSVDINNQHSSSQQGDLGYYFKMEEAMNGLERQSFTWGVCDAKDVDGNVIRADGNWYAMPGDLSENYEYGWWSGSISEATVEPTYGGYGFANNPTATYPFTAMPCNLIKVFTSEYYGQVHTYRLTVRSDEVGVANPLYSEVITFKDNQYVYEHFLPESLGHSTISEIEIEIISTKNPEDNARIQEINTIFEVDISDDVISMNTEKSRDLHITELPIAGEGSTSIDFVLDNTNKDYNIFNTSSLYGKYMKKNVRFKSTIGWQVKKSSDLYIDKILSSGISDTDTTFSLNDVSDLPDGGVGDYYVMVIDPDNYTREYVLVSSKAPNANDVYIVERGFNGSKARSHNSGVTVRFETFEYPAYVESWIDEWQGGSDNMTISANSTDWTKFASERIINNGFFIDKATTTDAVEGLLLTTNFPKKNFRGLNRYKKTASKNGAVLHLNFSEQALSGSGVDVVDYGLRARFFSMPSGQERLVKDIRADALDRELSPLEKALGELPSVTPDYTVNTQDINTNALYALDLVDFSYTRTDSSVVNTYYNMVFDGIYVAPDTGDQVLGVSIAHGGVRLYLEEILILDEYFSHPVSPGADTEVESDVVNLVAGKPYKIRVEAYHTVDTNTSDTFGIKLLYATGVDPLSPVPLEYTYRTSAFDIAGASDAPFTDLSTDRGKVTNNAVYSNGVEIGLEGGLVSDPENYAARINNTNYARLPYDQSWDMTDTGSENYTGKFSIELNVKSNEAAGFGSDGEYISTFGNFSPLDLSPALWLDASDTSTITAADGAWLDGTGLVLPGTTGNYASTPDSAALDITGDMEIVVRASMADWTPSSPLPMQGLVAKFDGPSGSGRSYFFRIRFDSNKLEFGWQDSGTASVRTLVADANISFSDNQIGWVKVEFDVDNGSSQAEAKFYTAADQATEPSVWTQLGSTKTSAGVAAIATGTVPVVIGSDQTATRAATGTFYRAIIRDGIGGTVVFDADFSAEAEGTLSFTEDSVNAATVTLTTTYGQVSQWDDKSGSGNDVVQATSAAQPKSGRRALNGLNVIDADGTDYMTNSTLALTAQPNTVFIVAKQDTDTDGALFDGITSTTRHMLYEGSSIWRFFAGTATGIVGAWDTNEHVFTCAFNGASSYLRIDGTQSANVDAGAQNLQGFTLFGSYGGAGRLSDGAIAEVIVIDGTLTADQIAATEAYLASKWGIDLSPSSSNGFEFFNDSSSNGFRIKTSAGVEEVSASGVLSASDWTHINVTFDGSDLKYYVNGDLEDTLTLSGSILSWADLDVTFGGRGSIYTIGTGQTGPYSGDCDFYCDQFIIYNKSLTDDQVADRYTEAVMQPITTYPFLYGNEASVRDIISEITLADLGRFYIDELGYGKYEHFYRYFEPSIDQHTIVQDTISDDTHIISADYNVQLQTNKVVVKIAGLSSNLSGTQSLWRADNPTILAVVNLELPTTADANSITVSSTVDPPFYNAGYLVIDDEIIKYSSKTPTTFNNLERGMFGTTAASHDADTPIREARYWDLKYNKAPAYNVKNPLISGIEFEDPDQIDILMWKPGFYGAELVLCADENIGVGEVVLVEGTDPISGKVSFAAIAGIPVLLTEQGSQIEEQVADLSESIRLYGLKEVVIENKFITDFNHGQKIADFIISKMSTPVPLINLNTILMPQAAIGDRIKISSLDAFDIINGEYWLISKSVSYGDSPSQSIILRKVV